MNGLEQITRDSVSGSIATRAMHIKAIRPEMREADFVASTDSIDSYGDSVTQNWDLSRYARNPIVLYAHDSRALPIGTSTRCAVISNQLECTIRFASAEANPEAEKVFKLVKEDVLKAVSVGFYPHSVRYEMREDVEVCILDDNELFEISVVPVPANPDALGKMKMRAKSALENKDMKNFEEAKAAFEAADKRASDLAEKLTTIETKHAALEKEHADLVKDHAEVVAEHETATKDLAEAQAKLAIVEQSEKTAKDELVVKEVESFVGTKILPAERDDYLELAKSDIERFRKMVKNRPDLKLLGASPITTETTQENTASAEPTGDDLAAEATKLAAAPTNDD